MNSTPKNRICDYVGGRDNNFNLLRFLAASLVIFSHAYPLTGGPHAEDPWERWTNESFGALAVNIFFITSGFLVTRSLLRHSFGDFVRARILRIFPGLVVALLFCAFFVGPIFTTLAVGDYWSHPDTYSFIARDALLLGWMQFHLPGVFANLPTPLNVNGSLWTLPWELRMYGLLAFLGWIGRGKRHLWIALLGLGAMILLTLDSSIGLSSNSYIQKGIRFTAFFFGGGALFVWRSRIVLRWTTFLVASGLTVVVWNTPAWSMAFPWLLLYLTMGLAYLPGGAIRSFNRFGDYSYGIYIYAFPVQQIVVHLWPSVSIPTMCAVTFAVVLPLSIASWQFVEKPMLALKR